MSRIDRNKAKGRQLLRELATLPEDDQRRILFEKWQQSQEDNQALKKQVKSLQNTIGIQDKRLKAADAAKHQLHHENKRLNLVLQNGIEYHLPSVRGGIVLLDWRGITFVHPELMNDWNRITNELNTTVVRINTLASLVGTRETLVNGLKEMSGELSKHLTRLLVFCDKYALPPDHATFIRIQRYSLAYEDALKIAINSKGSNLAPLFALAQNPDIERMFELNRSLIQQYQDALGKRTGAKKKPGRKFIADQVRVMTSKNPNLTQAEVNLRLLELDDKNLDREDQAALQQLKKSKNKLQYIRDCLSDYPE